MSISTQDVEKMRREVQKDTGALTEKKRELEKAKAKVQELEGEVSSIEARMAQHEADLDELTRAQEALKEALEKSGK